MKNSDRKKITKARRNRIRKNPAWSSRIRIFQSLLYESTFFHSHETSEAGAPNDCFLWNICSEKQKLPRIFYSLRKAKNF